MIDNEDIIAGLKVTTDDNNHLSSDVDRNRDSINLESANGDDTVSTGKFE